ncbi:DUF2147 domain-containing protein [Conchiformibius kuhniae]|uniref:DUF2147 domain-containing protein n=1 Tax=Conchiformibius kuhniae TaxID=211502 RepID=A0A8T9MUY9_9NEIS|nr:DUF2147 domain-containing protein [Conchiformibius kuhniae]UOP04168.1 DUF2147 domain-containing protein [Conchiformibius kuhniae]
MQKILFGLFALGAALAVSAAPIEGKWRTTDDKTGKPKAVVHISKSGAAYQGKIVSLAQGVENVCPACEDKRPLVGMVVLTGLKGDEQTYEGGKIFDPKGGKTYKAKAELSADGKALKVRGYFGVSLLGRTQTWVRAD